MRSNVVFPLWEFLSHGSRCRKLSPPPTPKFHSTFQNTMLISLIHYTNSLHYLVRDGSPSWNISAERAKHKRWTKKHKKTRVMAGISSVLIDCKDMGSKIYPALFWGVKKTDVVFMWLPCGFHVVFAASQRFIPRFSVG